MPSTVWPLEPHTRAKHDLLAGYLGAWFGILASRSTRLVFIDGFAGPGTYKDGEEGSPIIALRTLLDAESNLLRNCEFVFLFNESDPARFATLQRSVRDFCAGHGQLPSNVKVDLKCSPFAELADELIALQDQTGRTLTPTFALIDPAGYRDVSVQQIGQLLRARSSEAFVYFDTNSVNRFAQSGKVDARLRELFGSNDCLQAPPPGSKGRVKWFVDLFERKLRETAGFGYTQSFRMRNRRNRVICHMVFATRNLTGLDKMKQAMWKVDPRGEYDFADSLANQEVLFAGDDTGPLQRALAEKFAGQVVDVDVVSRYVIESTPYHSGHLKTKTLVPMERNGVISVRQRGRAFTYPKGSRIQFGASGARSDDV